MDQRVGWGGQGHRRRIALYLFGLGAIVLGYTVAYLIAMWLFEGQRVPVTRAFLVVIESFTTTGYGTDADVWSTAPMRLFAVAMQLTGVAMIFLALPVFVAPYVRDQLSSAPPDSVGDLSDHVVIAGYTRRGAALVSELVARDHPYVVVEADRDRALELYHEGLSVVHGDPEESETLLAANVSEAGTLVADVDDETNASIALTAKSIDETEVLTFVSDPEVAEYHRYAGADQVFLPRQLIAASLARKVTAGVSEELAGAIEIGEGFDIVELPVQAGSELEGVTVGESGIRERTGMNVVGAWFRGEFVSPPPPEARIDAQTILVVAGLEEQLEQLKQLTLSEERQPGEGHVIIGGYGQVGAAISDFLNAKEVETVVVDIEDRPGVNVVGDVTEETTLRRAGIEEASTLLLAVADDTDEVFATLVARELNPAVEVIARAEATESVKKLYLAGADYVLAVATVAGRMLASTVMEEEVISFDQQLEIIRLDVGSLVGETLASADIRARTGCTVIAVDRADETYTDLDPDFEFEEDDELVVAGTDEDVNRFTSLTD